MSNLTGKVAIVTGASKGIGAAIAKSLAAAGASVTVNYSSSREGADRIVAEITSAGGKAIASQGSVAKAADVKRVFEETQAAFGSVDVVVNNAGVYQFDPIENITEDEFHRQFNTNVLGPILTTQEALKHFPTKGGSIINISSVVSNGAIPNAGVYASTKGALDTLTDVLAKELGSRNIRVNTVAPGATVTEGAQDFMAGDFAKQVISQTPLGRLAQAEDIAPIVLFLASDDSSWMTGEYIRASGGLK